MGFGRSSEPGQFKPETTKAIIELLREGATRTAASAAGRVTTMSFRNWFNRGERELSEAVRVADEAGSQLDPDELSTHVEFYLDVLEAEGSCQSTWAKRLADSEDLANTRWLLERRFPEGYGNRARVEHTGAGGGPIEVTNNARLALIKRLGDSLERAGFALDDPEGSEAPGDGGGPEAAP